ncbi:MAG: copper homeostasis protein CutC [Gemmata sp.]
MRFEIPNLGTRTFDPAFVELGPAQYPASVPGAPGGLPPRGLQPDLLAPETKRLIRNTQVNHIGDEGERGQGPRNTGVTLIGGARSLIDAVRPVVPDENLALETGTEVTGLEAADRRWRVHTRAPGPAGDGPLARTITADAVLLTQPVPDALGLLEASKIGVPDALRDELRKIRYRRAIAVLAAFREQPLPVRPLIEFSGSTLELMFNNQQPGVHFAGPTLTGLTSCQWTDAHWAEDDAAIEAHLRPEVARWVGAQPVGFRVHRRERDRAVGQVRMPFAEVSEVPPLVLAGDGFANYVANALDAAATSGTHAADRLCKALAREIRLAGRRIHRTPSPVRLEVLVSSAAEARDAIECGADRVLLCSAPELGGLTPTTDALHLVRRVVKHAARPVEVLVQVRPRCGGFAYSTIEFEQMLRDARRLLKAGADGIAFGCLHRDGDEVRIDRGRCQQLVKQARKFRRIAVFNRAFDCVADRLTGLQDLVALGLDRVYSSGGQALAVDGVARLREDVGYAGWDLEVIAAGEFDAHVVVYIANETGCDGVLVDSRHQSHDQTANAQIFDGVHNAMDARGVQEISRALRAQHCSAQF